MVRLLIWKANVTKPIPPAGPVPWAEILHLPITDKKFFAVNAQAHVQYKSPKSLYLFLGGYGFLKGDDKSFVDYGFLHFRYNYKLNKTVRLEAFTQLQQNVITKINFRFLIGVGPRFKILGSQKITHLCRHIAHVRNRKRNQCTQADT